MTSASDKGRADQQGQSATARLARARFGAVRPWRAWGKLLLTTALLGIAAWFLYREFREVDAAALRSVLRGIPPAALALAVCGTILSFATLSSFDYLALRQLRISFSLRRTYLTAFTCYAFNFNFGSLIGAVGMRYRLYAKGGLSAGDVTRITVSSAATSWTGYCVFAGVTLSLMTLPVPPSLGLPIASFKPFGILLLCMSIAYLCLCATRKKPLEIGRWRYELPELPDACLHIGVASVQWFLISAVLYLMFPAALGMSFETVLAIHLLAAVAGLVLHVPAGLGVIEGSFLLMLSQTVPKEVILGSLLAFRATYYLTPLLFALVALVWLELEPGAKSSRPSSP